MRVAAAGRHAGGERAAYVGAQVGEVGLGVAVEAQGDGGVDGRDGGGADGCAGVRCQVHALSRGLHVVWVQTQQLALLHARTQESRGEALMGTSARAPGSKASAQPTW